MYYGFNDFMSARTCFKRFFFCLKFYLKHLLYLCVMCSLCAKKYDYEKKAITCFNDVSFIYRIEVLNLII